MILKSHRITVETAFEVLKSYAMITIKLYSI